MSSLIDNLKGESPLIKWLIDNLPSLVKSFVMAVLVTYLSQQVFVLNKVWDLGVIIFVVSTVIAHYAPKLFNALQYGIGFAFALLIIRSKPKLY